MKGAAEIIGVESGDDDPLAHIGQADDEIDHGFAKELRFINADDFGPQIKLGLDFLGVIDGIGVNAAVIMGDDLV